MTKAAQGIPWVVVNGVPVVEDGQATTAVPGAVLRPLMARTLPLLRDWNRAFWTSGEDGRLRFQHCTACDRLQHPPAPVCRSCGQDDLDEQAVSGRATVQGHTWSGREGAPVAAVVAIDEDPTIHLTTNLVGVDPESV